MTYYVPFEGSGALPYVEPYIDPAPEEHARLLADIQRRATIVARPAERRMIITDDRGSDRTWIFGDPVPDGWRVHGIC